ncbi:hypothetical protein [Nonomuraea sp. SBT364]|uniref:hypothetical protein n=1 Tax=Nonomuraea sp. SBT364 TaxID=1580530 RepID=UPI00066C85AA|nr:hypothetical protein [Nonomuraea sp. SBT364]
MLSAFTSAYPKARTSWRQVFMPVGSERLTLEPLRAVPRALAVPIGHPFRDAASVRCTDVLDQPLVPVAPAVPGRGARWVAPPTSC